MSPMITPAGGPHLRADQDLVLIGMFLLGHGVLLVDGLLTEARRQIRAIAQTRLFVAHRSLVPAAWPLAHGGCPVSSGEGFGLVLPEAQVAGKAVTGPAYGGPHDAYVEWVTGYAPTDESATELAMVLEQLLRDPGQLAEMGRRVAAWVRQCFAPDRYALQAVARFL